MIRSFGNRLAQALFEDRDTRRSRAWPPGLRRAARRKLLYLHDAAELEDLRVPPGNRLKALKGDRRGLYASRINDQWRVCFVWREGNAWDVTVEDYH